MSCHVNAALKSSEWRLLVSLHRLNDPWGTAENPVQVTSYFDERIVGVPDPSDDSIIWWGSVKNGKPPMQVIEGGEFFVLKKLESEGGHH